MNEPKRYMPSSHRSADFGMAESREGNWVAYADYAELKQKYHDLEYCKSSISYGEHSRSVDKVWELYHKTAAAHDAVVVEFRKVDAENERLRKAGDAVVAAYCMGDKNIDKWKEYPVVREWLAAKGVQS